MPDYDEYGIPIKTKPSKTLQPANEEVDDFGIPIKKKVSSTTQFDAFPTLETGLVEPISNISPSKSSSLLEKSVSAFKMRPITSRINPDGTAVLKNPNKLYNDSDDAELAVLTSKYKPTTLQGIYDVADVVNEQLGIPKEVSADVSTNPYSLKLKEANALETSIKKKILDRQITASQTSEFAAGKDNVIAPEENDELNRVKSLQKKLSAELTVDGIKEADAVLSTNESGNLFNKFVTRAKVMMGDPTGTIELSQETEDRIGKLPTEFFTGLNYYKNAEPVVFERLTNAINNGQPISESQVAQVTAEGLSIEQSKLERSVQLQEITPEEFNKQSIELQKKKTDNLLNNKETLRAVLSNGIAEDLYKKEDGDFRWNFDDTEIKASAEKWSLEHGLDPNNPKVKEAIKYLQDNEGAMIMQNSIAKSGIVRELGKGLAEPIRGIFSSLESASKDANDVYAEGQSQGNVNVSEQRLKAEDTGWRGVVNDITKGAGQFATQAGVALGTSGLIGSVAEGLTLANAGATTAGEIIGLAPRIGQAVNAAKDFASTLTTSFAQVYDSNLKTALNYTSNNTVAKNAAFINSTIEGLSENILSPIDIARGIGNAFKPKGAMEGLVKVLTEKNILKEPSLLNDYVAATLRGGLATVKVGGTEIAEEFVTQIADFTTNAFLNPNSKSFQDRELANELAQTAYQTGLSMAIPALASGIGAGNVNSFAKGSLMIAAQNRQTLIDNLTTKLAEDNISEDEYNRKVAIINTAAKANETLPLKADNAPLNSDEKADYVFSRVSEGVMQKKMEESTDEAEKQVYAAKIKEQQDFRSGILKTSIEIVQENKPDVTSDTNATTEGANINTTVQDISGNDDVNTNAESQSGNEASITAETDSEKTLVEKIKEKNIPNLINDQFSEEENLKFLQEQSISAPNSFKNQIGGDEGLATDLIATNSIEAINKELAFQEQQLKSPDLTDNDITEIDNHIQLLEKGLAKKEKSFKGEPEQISQPIELSIEPSTVKSEEVKDTELYHGSRFKFDEFNTDKINTGQVSQDFGWGLYFTSKKEVGEHYANMLSNNKTANEKFADNIKSVKDDILNDYIDKNNTVGAKRRIDTLLKDEKLSVESKTELNKLKESLDNTERYGYLYNVSVDKNAKFLDYAGDISKADLQKINEGLKQPIESSNEIPVAVVYNQLIKEFGSKKAASLYLLSKGVNGFKYKIDTLGKKGIAGNEGEFNYSIFDPTVISKTQSEKLDFKGVFNLNEPAKSENKPIQNESATGAVTKPIPTNEKQSTGQGTKAAVSGTTQKNNRGWAEATTSVLNKKIEDVSVEDIMAEIESLNKVSTIGDADMSNSVLKSGDKEKIQEYISKAKAVLGGLYPKAKLEVYNNSKDYEDAGGSDGSRGFAIMAKNGEHRILLNLQQISEDNSSKTALHEVIHPIVYDAFSINQEKLVPIWNEIASTMKDVKGMEEVFNHTQWYGQDKVSAEGITETLTQIAAGNIDLKDVPQSTLNKIIDLINRLFNQLGIGLQLNSINDFAEISKKIKQSFDNSNAESLKDVIKGQNIDKFIADYEKIADRDAGSDKLKQLQDLLKAKVEAEVKSGKLTQAQADKILSDAGITKDYKPEELAAKIKNDEINYDDAIEGKSQDFIKKLDSALFGSDKFKLNEDVFKKRVRDQKEYGISEADVVANYEAIKKLTKRQKELIGEVYGETAATDKEAAELQDAFRQLAKGEKPKKVLKRLGISDVTHLVKALSDALGYKAVSNVQLEAMADYIVDSIELDKSDKYINAMINNSMSDVKQLLRAKLIVALQNDGNDTLATQLVRDMADDAVSAGRQTQSLKKAYEILGAKGSPKIRTAFQMKYAESVQKKALEMNKKLASVVSDQEAEIGRLNERIHSAAQKTTAMSKIKELISNLCNLRGKK